MKQLSDDNIAFRGNIEKIWYRNDDTGYKIIKLVNKHFEEITAKGVIPFVEEGNFIEVYGRLDEDDYGSPIIIAKKSNLIEHTDVEFLYTYLANGNVKYIGEKIAKKIIEKFGDETHDILMNNPKKLSLIRGIGEKRAEEIVDQYSENAHRIKTYSYLSKLNISQVYINKIIKVFDNNAIDIIEKNPYELVSKIKGIGFKKADEIASNLGIKKDSIFRKKAGILHILQEALLSGDTLVNDIMIFDKLKGLLDINVDISEFREIIQELYIEDSIYLESGKDGVINVYLSYIYKKELSLSTKIKCMIMRFDDDEKSIKIRAKDIGSELGINLDDNQLNAVIKAISNNFVVITGGPGTGKTTLINTILKYFLDMRLSVKLVAPTACAAKRMEAVTDYEASTIHRLLEVQPMEDEVYESYGRNVSNKLECDVLIVDEASMVDLNLFNALLDACDDDMRVILVGDVNQLPSVGAGNVLRDIIESEIVPVIKLNKIYRQSNGKSSGQIVKIANDILSGNAVHIDNSIDSDLFFIKINENNFENQLIDTIKRISSKFNIDIEDIQVLIPQKQTKFGVENVNKILQKNLNESNDLVSLYDKIFKYNDKVIHTKNNYIKETIAKNDEDSSQGVFNGDVGYINSIFDKNSFCVEYEDKYVNYSSYEVNELELAYAITVHKSQGSEYPAVILILKSVPFNLKMRALLYTAITRAKKIVVIIGEESAFSDMVRNISKVKRYTGLKEKLRGINEKIFG